MINWNTKTNQQLKVLHMNKMLQCVTHIWSEFAHEPNYCLNGEITMEGRTAHNTVRRLIVYSGILEQRWETCKPIHDLWKYPWYILVLIKLNLQFRSPASHRTVKSPTMVIFDDTQHLIAVPRRWCRRHKWWRHQMDTFSASQALCAGKSPVTGEFPSQRSGTRSFDVFYDLRLNKRLSKQSWGWWFETLSCSLLRHCNE